MNKYKKLKELIYSDETLVVPDAYNGITARLIEYAGFEAVQCSGYCFSLSKSYSEESLVSLTENLLITEEIVNSVELPVFADGEDGYGSGKLFENNMIKFMKKGIAGINIEDQNLWSPFYTEKILPVTEMQSKIKTIIDLKKQFNLPDFIINSRTDILGSFDDRKKGLKKAIERANIYIEAGADMAFVTSVRTKEELKILNREICGPLTVAAGLAYNINNYDINDCKEIGIARVSLPSTLLLTSLKAQLNALKELKLDGSFSNVKDKLINIDTLKKGLLGLT